METLEKRGKEVTKREAVASNRMESGTMRQSRTFAGAVDLLVDRGRRHDVMQEERATAKQTTGKGNVLALQCCFYFSQDNLPHTHTYTTLSVSLFRERKLAPVICVWQNSSATGKQAAFERCCASKPSGILASHVFVHSSARHARVPLKASPNHFPKRKKSKGKKETKRKKNECGRKQKEERKN